VRTLNFSGCWSDGQSGDRGGGEERADDHESGLELHGRWLFCTNVFDRVVIVRDERAYESGRSGTGERRAELGLYHTSVLGRQR